MSEEPFERPATEQALALRQRIKSKKPRFRRQESWRYKRVSDVWRKPDGVDSKMRKKKKGWPKSVHVGYRGPKVARGLHPSGYSEVLVRTPDDLADVDPKTQAVRIAHTVGLKKRADISLRAGERGIHILNPLPTVKPEEEEVPEVGKEAEAEVEAAAEGETETEAEEPTEEKKKKKEAEQES